MMPSFHFIYSLQLDCASRFSSTFNLPVTAFSFGKLIHGK